jgi:hypothetical protein
VEKLDGKFSDGHIERWRSYSLSWEDGL